MSDTPETNAAPAAETVTTEPVAPSTPSEPTGQPTQTDTQPAPEPVAQPQIDPSIIRNAEAYKGARPLIDTLVQNNIRTPEDLQRFIELDAVARERQLDIGQLTNVLRGKPQETPEQSQENQYLTKDDLVTTLEKHDAMSQFNNELSAMDSAVNSVRQEIAQSTGTSADDPVLSMVVDGMIDKAQNESFYPANHPLHTERLKPLDASQISQIKEQAIQSITAFRGQAAVANANQALASTPQQPTGSGLQSRPGEGVEQIYNPNAGSTQQDIADAESILARAFGSTNPGVVADSV